MKRFHEGDNVSHPILGEGEVVEVMNDTENTFQCYARVDWDRDPPENYNGGINPCLEYLSSITLLE